MSWHQQGGGNPQYNYGPPQQQYPSPQPPHSPYQQPPYGQQPPPMQHQQYQQGGWGAPPQGQYPPPHQQGPPPQQQQWGAPPPPQGQQQWGAPPPGQYGYGAPPAQPAPPSLGYGTQVANVNCSQDVEALHRAMKGLGTDEKTLIRVLTSIPDPVIMSALRQQFHQQKKGKDLLQEVQKETSNHFEEGLCALIRGPLEQDAWNLDNAIRGAGTKEIVLDDVLLGRSNADIHAIKTQYQRMTGKSLDTEVSQDLSMKTKELFRMILSATRAEESTPIIPQQLEHDVSELHRATQGTKMGTDQITVCQIFASRSDGQLRAISQEFHRKYSRPLMQVVERSFEGHMEAALMRMLAIAEDKAGADAKRLEDAMRGPGTKDTLLVNRLVRYHWDKTHMQQVRGAYKHFFKTELRTRVQGETSGDFGALCVALVGQ